MIDSGSHRLGPDNARLTVRTRRTGAAAKAGHDLEIAVTAWEATLDLAEETTMELRADATSLRVQRGTGGMQALGEDDKASIHKTIDDEVLRRRDIVFRSTAVAAAPGGLRVEGELTLAGQTRPIGFDLSVSEGGALSATAVVKQTAWGMKPYSALFGTLKVVDEVEVVLDAHLRPQSR